MGGPMGALDYDKYPGLKAEAKLARAAISVGQAGAGRVPRTSDHCHRAGCETQKGSEPEIGFAPIKRIDKHDYFSMWNKRIDVLHWHNDVVSRPEVRSRSHVPRPPRTRRSVSVRRSACNSISKSPDIAGGMARRAEHGQGSEAAGGSKSQLREDFAEYNPRAAAARRPGVLRIRGQMYSYAATLR